PVAVSAFSDENLQQQQIENTLDLQQALPNTTFTKGNFTGSNITIRGIGSAAVAASGDAGVGVHYNDMPLVASRLFENEFFDLERIEVLRGPQGTLFGRNATGGVINLITAKPDLSGFGASGEFEYGNFESIVGRGMINVPLGDIAAVRVAGIYINRDGYTENIATGNDIDGRDSYAIRGSLRLEPTDRTTFTLTGEYFDEDSDRSRIQKQLCATDPTGVLGCRPDILATQPVNANATLANIFASTELLNIATGGALGAFGLGSIYDENPFSNAIVPDDLRQVAIDFEPTYEADQFTIQGELEHDFGGLIATLNGGYSETSVRSRTDYNLTITNSVVPFINGLQALAAGGQDFDGDGIDDDPNPIALGLLSTPLFQGNQICVSEVSDRGVGIANNEINRCADNTTEYDESGADTEQWSIEGRVASDFDGPFNFLVGGLYLENEVTNSDYFVAASGLDYGSLIFGGPASGFTAIAGTPFFNNEADLVKLESYGIFGEVYFDVSDSVKLTGGLRYSNDKKFVRDRQYPLLAAGVPLPFGTEDLFVPELLTTYDADATVPGNQPFREIQFNDDAITGRVVIDWRPVTSFSDDTLFYASYSRGYKPGGVNPNFDPTLFTAPAVFEKETINAFELGTKNTFLDGTLQLNLTGFYYDYGGLQVSRIINRTSFNDNTDAEVYGVELESVLNPTPPLTINVTASYQKTKVKDLVVNDTRDPSAGRDDVVIIKDLESAANCILAPSTPGGLDQATLGAIVSGFNSALGLQGPEAIPGTNTIGAFSLCSALAATAASGAFGLPGEAFLLEFLNDGTPVLPSGIEQNLAGNELENSPQFKFSLGAQYEIDVANSGWTATPRIDVNFTGNAFSSRFNEPTDKIPAYEIVNAQLTVRSPDDRFYIRGFVQNMFDVEAVTGRSRTDPSSGLFTNIFLTEPRRYGAAVGFKF
ncbi:MAG: TonB-dependent receptor, partial [Pacificimonas sp.]